MTLPVAFEIPVAQAYPVMNGLNDNLLRERSIETTYPESLVMPFALATLSIGGVALLGRAIALTLTDDSNIILASVIGAGLTGVSVCSFFYMACFGGAQEVQGSRQERSGVSEHEQYFSIRQVDIFGALTLAV